MSIAPGTSANVRQAVPFFGVTDMEASLRFYVDGLGFKMKHRWIPDRADNNPDGRIRCIEQAQHHHEVLLYEERLSSPQRRRILDLNSYGGKSRV
jgi:catechol 2,3-dioxygenase-like lactoylglutathione lyase family enzyme